MHPIHVLYQGTQVACFKLVSLEFEQICLIVFVLFLGTVKAAYGSVPGSAVAVVRSCARAAASDALRSVAQGPVWLPQRSRHWRQQIPQRRLRSQMVTNSQYLLISLSAGGLIFKV